MSTTSSQNCPQCGAPLPAKARAGLCPNCVMVMNLATQTEFTGDPGPGARSPKMEPPPPEALAARFPQLEILELLGRGGMGAVYKARQRDLDRIVALKILPPGTGEDPAFAERFTREARALAKLNHPHIVTLYEFGQTRSVRAGEAEDRQTPLFYFLMEFVDGLNLRQVLDAARIRPGEALAIVPQICEALQYAHERGIIHRDIKPENILMSREGRVKIADFGVAKLVGTARAPGIRGTGGNGDGSGDAEDGPAAIVAGDGSALPVTDAGKVMGTPQYMAPEQMERPGEVDHRADIYALGVVFYQMLTGELPGRRIEPPSRKVQIDVRLDEVVLRALEKEPEQRYQQASQVKTDVEMVAMTSGSSGDKHRSAAPGIETLGPRVSGDRPRRSAGIFAVALAFVLLTAASAVAWMLAAGNPVEPESAAAPPDGGNPGMEQGATIAPGAAQAASGVSALEMDARAILMKQDGGALLVVNAYLTNKGEQDVVVLSEGGGWGIGADARGIIADFNFTGRETDPQGRLNVPPVSSFAPITLRPGETTGLMARHSGPMVEPLNDGDPIRVTYQVWSGWGERFGAWHGMLRTDVAVTEYVEEIVKPLAEPDAVVEFADANLEAAVRRKLNIPDDAITAEAMLRLIDLEVSAGDNPINLAGLEHARRLGSLRLHGPVLDLGPLTKLPRLSALTGVGSGIADIRPLAQMTTLTFLHWRDSGVRDLSPLAGLTGLGTLGLSNNAIEDISPLEKLTGLSRLFLNGNAITDVSPLKSLTHLTTLWLARNEITDINPLAGLAAMESLVASNNRITDVRPLEALTGLRQLLLNDNDIEDIRPLISLVRLEQLSLTRNRIADATVPGSPSRTLIETLEARGVQVRVEPQR